VEEQGISIVVTKKEGKDSGAKSGREQLVYTSSSKKLWLSSDIKLEWEIKQEMGSSLDFECNIFFSHPHLNVANRWEKLKRIKKTLQLTCFRVFIIVKKEYINKKLEHSFLKVWKYWHVKQNKKLIEKQK